ncbi:hypothetical protein [Catenuloplanes indicus]|uniref:YD repeat-containing protein n=1 Tax=Catenuloplanes indicus TaxID=137267 RepID=A0AAE4AWH8_9ACTN|nr:hypothetical protein [Catenuloplanes indicus]MDQ0365027.1 YD repeat-containing protein [Catenuloplanes indicus]
MGRISRVWDAGWTKADHPDAPQGRYEYVYASDRRSYPYTKTETLHAGGGYHVSYGIFDGFLRIQQSRTPAQDGSGTRVISDTNYDEAGRTATVYGAHAEPGSPSGAYWYEPQWSVPSVTRNVYDRAGRLTAAISLAGEGETNQVEKSRTTTVYAGDRTMVTPPRGGVATTITDLQGHVTEFRRHTTAAGVNGAFSATSYSYDRKGHLARVTDAAGNEYQGPGDLAEGPGRRDHDHHLQRVRRGREDHRAVRPGAGRTSRRWGSTSPQASCAVAREAIPDGDGFPSLPGVASTLLGTGVRREEPVNLDLERLAPHAPDALRTAKKAMIGGVNGKGGTSRTLFRRDSGPGAAKPLNLSSAGSIYPRGPVLRDSAPPCQHPFRKSQTDEQMS